MKRKTISILASLTISIILLFILLKQIQFKDLIQTLKSIHIIGLFGYMSLALSTAILRTWRYQILLKPYPSQFDRLFLVTLIRNLFVDLFPARIGSLSYVYLVNKKLKYTFEAAASTFLLSFIYDFLTLSPFLIISIFIVGFGTTPLSSSIMLISSIVFLFVLIVIFWKIELFLEALRKFFKFLLSLFHHNEKTWAKTGLEKFDLTQEEISRIKKEKYHGLVILISFFIRGGKYMALYVLLFSLLSSHGFGLFDLSIWKTILGITGAELTSVLPVKGLAGFGTWESAWALTFQLMKFDPQLSIISGLGIHLLSNLYEYSLGILAIIILAIIPAGKRIKKSNFPQNSY
ncbi:MAG: lysylphosphatidylglycerol synthase transmembrane domain-containing protein [Acidobacteriota bacterium]